MQTPSVLKPGRLITVRWALEANKTASDTALRRLPRTTMKSLQRLGNARRRLSVEVKGTYKAAAEINLRINIR